MANVRDEFNVKTAILDEYMSAHQETLKALQEERIYVRKMMAKQEASIEALQKSNQVLRDFAAKTIAEEVKKSISQMRVLRSSQADLAADMTELKNQIQQLKGTEEELQKNLSTTTANDDLAREELKNLTSKYDELVRKLTLLETSLGLGSAPPAAIKPATENDKTAAAPTGTSSDAGKAYDTAYSIFLSGDYDKARNSFLEFLKQHGDSHYADNAIFWIGECYFHEKRFEEAILEYDKVITKYPEGNKMPVALFKQALSFLNLGDRESGTFLLQQVIKDYPNTSQARMAKKRLDDLK